MKKFKDFLYDKNDILIAVLILVVAASIIAWRMDVILQYPKQLIHNDKQIETPTVDPSKTDDTSKGDNKDDANKGGDAATGNKGDHTGNGSDANTGNNGGDDANSGTGTQGTTELWAAGALTRDVEVDVTEDLDAAATLVLSGGVAALGETFGAHAVLIDARTYPVRSVAEPESDRVMRGARDGFVETLIFNTALLRRRIRTPKLRVIYKSVGKESKTDMAIVYIEGRRTRSTSNTSKRSWTPSTPTACRWGTRALPSA